MHPAGIEPTLLSIALTIQPWMQRESASELGFGMDSRASISSVKGDSRKDGIGRRVSRTKKIRVERGELAKLDKIGMGIEHVLMYNDGGINNFLWLSVGETVIPLCLFLGAPDLGKINSKNYAC